VGDIATLNNHQPKAGSNVRDIVRKAYEKGSPIGDPLEACGEVLI
jgi:hypothetical protein